MPDLTIIQIKRVKGKTQEFYWRIATVDYYSKRDKSFIRRLIAGVRMREDPLESAATNISSLGTLRTVAVSIFPRIYSEQETIKHCKAVFGNAFSIYDTRGWRV